MPNTKTPTAVTHEPFSPEWWDGARLALAVAQKAALRPASAATAAANRIVSAVNAAGRPHHQPGTVPPWTGEQPLRLWDKSCAGLLSLITRKDHRTRMLRDYEVINLATLTMQFLQVAGQLFAEVAPALLASAPGDDCQDLKSKLDIKTLESALNYTLVPKVIDAHQTLTVCAIELASGGAVRDCVAWPAIAIAENVADFARALCLTAEHHAPASNPYAALVSDEFMADIRAIKALEDRQ